MRDEVILLTPEIIIEKLDIGEHQLVEEGIASQELKTLKIVYLLKLEIGMELHRLLVMFTKYFKICSFVQFLLVIKCFILTNQSI